VVQGIEAFEAKLEAAVLAGQGEDPSDGKVEDYAVRSLERVPARVAEGTGGRNSITGWIEPFCEGSV
jgi:hypothetical protein